ncbi:MAG: N-acetyltransferase family protein [Acidimicrobiia bacterium]
MGFEPISIELGGGVSLRVRRLGADDVAAVEALYDLLSPEDRRLRFFSAFRPGAPFIERWLTGDGNVVLGAFAGEALVGEVGYARLANGNAELGITVADGWRGWLGPFLLDVLAGAAREAGVPNLEADVRLENRSMLGLIGRRGAAVVDQPRDAQVRVVMGTGARVPGWPPERAPGSLRVLVEAPAGRWSAAGAAGAGPGSAGEPPAGVEVLACAGPAGRRRGSCPLLDGGRCPLVDGADEVVVVTGSEREAVFGRLAAAHRERAGAGGPPVHTCGLSSAVGEVLRAIAAERATSSDRPDPPPN